MTSTTTQNSAARDAGQTFKSIGQKFSVGDVIIVKGHRATVIEAHSEIFPRYYVIECANGKHILEFADQSFCDLA